MDTTSIGWECPRCHRCYSPRVPQCHAVDCAPEDRSSALPLLSSARCHELTKRNDEDEGND